MSPRDRPLLIALSGRLDLYAEAHLYEALTPSLDAPRVVVDFGNVDYLDAAAIGVLLRVRRRRAERGFEPIRFAAMPAKLERIFAIAKLDRIWRFYPTVDAAMSSFETLG